MRIENLSFHLRRNKMTKQLCPICGELQQEHKIKPMTYTYKDIRFVIDQPAFWCDACGEGIIDSKDNKVVIHLIQAEKSRIDGLLTPFEIRYIRAKVLNLTQKEAGFLFGGGVNAFNRYEQGKSPVPKPLSQLLTVLKNHPNQLAEIQNNYNSK